MVINLSGINSAVTERLRNILGVQTAIEAIPKAIVDTIQPVISADPKPLIKTASVNLIDATAATIFTARKDKNTYIVDCSLSISKDAVNDSVNTGIIFNEWGNSNTTKDLIKVRYEPEISSSMHEVLSFAYPVKIEPNKNVTISHSSAISSIKGTGIIRYYEEDII